MRLLHSIQPGPQAAKGRLSFAPPVQQQMQQQQQQQQQQQMVPEDPSALAPMSAELRRQIAGAARAVGAGDLPRDMQTYIESKVIEPAFTRANQAWAVRPSHRPARDCHNLARTSPRQRLRRLELRRSSNTSRCR